MSRTFFRKFFPAVPRAAGRPALRASALRGGEFGIIRAPGAARAGNPPAHRMPTTPARRSAGGWRPPGSWRFASVHIYRRNRPGGPALARLDPPGRSIRPRTFNHLYISRRIGLTFRPGVLPPSSCKLRFPYRWLSPARFRQASRGGGGLPREERPSPGPPAFRTSNPLGDRPWSILYVGGFPSFRY